MGKNVFISYSSKDGKLAAELCKYLEGNGKTCFIAPRDIRAGFEYAEEIVTGIDEAEMMVLILSESSNQSQHVLREVERAVSKDVPIIIYKIDDVVLSKSMEYFLMTHQWMESKKSKDFGKLLDAVNQHETQKEKLVEIKSESIDKEDNKENKEASKNKLFIGIVSAAVAVVAVVCIICFAVLGGKDNNSSQTSNKTDGQDSSKYKIEADLSNLKLGDTVTFGSYNGEKIQWKVLKLEDDKAVLISNEIITIKAFDGAESGKFDTYEGKKYLSTDTEPDEDFKLQIMLRGNSDWSTSNIRTWLNSFSDYVKYEDTPPKGDAMSEHRNGYDAEAGFLYEFSEAERGVIAPTLNKTKGNALASEEYIETTDYVYLLSQEDLSLFEKANINIYATVTDAAKEQDNAKWYNSIMDTINSDFYFWWLRDADAEYSSKAFIVLNGYTDDIVISKNVCSEGYGIRPAITIDLTKVQ